MDEFELRESLKATAASLVVLQHKLTRRHLHIAVRGRSLPNADPFIRRSRCGRQGPYAPQPARGLRLRAGRLQR
ncbi:hypothetical protein C6V04_21325 [Burkholderia multivorans]|nr:hypothetical protein C6V04_21325 [Burkholderia multivorans]